jgi:hypothetical protein
MLNSGTNTVGENIIATIKIRKNYDAIQSFIFQYCDTNIGLFSIAPCKVITLNPFYRFPLLFANAFKSVKERQLLLSQ